jgi:AcrR family transcriptional regulator
MSKAKRQRDADNSRQRIFEAARVRFSNCSYEGVGVREIAADAGLDPALVARYFGSKEGLFREVAAQAFDSKALLTEGIERLPLNSSKMLFDAVDADVWRTGYDPLRLLLASIGSPSVGPFLAEALTKDFLHPLQRALKGKNSGERGTMISAQIIGMGLMRVVLGTGNKASRDRLQSLFTEFLSTQI